MGSVNPVDISCYSRCLSRFRSFSVRASQASFSCKLRTGCREQQEGRHYGRYDLSHKHHLLSLRSKPILSRHAHRVKQKTGLMRPALMQPRTVTSP
nr:MAG TPA: hypothetical protein [Caudoviricetes sp.]